MKSVNRHALLSLATLAALTACGPMQQDPTADYEITKKTTETTKQDVRDQTAPDSGLVQIEIDEMDQKEGDAILNFTEGDSASYVITPRVLVPGIKYSLSIAGAPEGVSLKPRKAGSPARGYVLSWTPKVGFVGVNKPSKPVAVTFKINISDDSAPKAKSTLSSLRARLTRTTSLIVSRTSKLPTVTQVKKASDEVVQGESVKVTVVVKDPSAFGKEAPELAVVNSRANNSDYKFVRGATMVEEVSVDEDGGNFVFVLKLDTKNVAVPEKASSVDVKFLVRAIGTSNLRSADSEVTIKVLKKEVPEPAAKPASSQAPKPASGAKP